MTVRKFKKLVQQHRNRIYTFAFYYSGHPEEAEDIAQEVLMRVWKYGGAVEAKKLSAWIARVTRNACVDAHRRRRAFAEATGRMPFRDNVWRGADSAGLSPEKLAEASDLREKIECALARIDEPFRSILILREIQDLTYEQISDVLELPLNTIKVYLHRGRHKLRDQMMKMLDYEIK